MLTGCATAAAATAAASAAAGALSLLLIPDHAPDDQCNDHHESRNDNDVTQGHSVHLFLTLYTDFYIGVCIFVLPEGQIQQSCQGSHRSIGKDAEHSLAGEQSCQLINNH